MGIIFILLSGRSQLHRRNGDVGGPQPHGVGGTATVSACAQFIIVGLYWRIAADRGPNANCGTPHIRRGLSRRLYQSAQEHGVQGLDQSDETEIGHQKRSGASVEHGRVAVCCNGRVLEELTSRT